MNYPLQAKLESLLEVLINFTKVPFMDAVDFIIRLRAWTCLKARYSLRDYRNVLMFFVFNLVKILWLWSFDLLIRTCLCVNLLRIALESCSKISLREKCPNTKFFLVRIQSEYLKIRARKNSVFGHSSRSV